MRKRLLIGLAALTVVAFAVPASGQVFGTSIFTRTESGRGANITAVIGLGKHYNAYTFVISTRPVGLPMRVSSATKLPTNPSLDTHSPFRHSVRCSHPCALEVSARLGLFSTKPPKSVTGRLTVSVSVP